MPIFTAKINKLEDEIGFQVKVEQVKLRGKKIMFLTIGLIIGFILGWYVNEKFEDLAVG